MIIPNKDLYVFISHDDIRAMGTEEEMRQFKIDVVKDMPYMKDQIKFGFAKIMTFDAAMRKIRNDATEGMKSVEGW